jgi:transposase, IS5 family
MAVKRTGQLSFAEALMPTARQGQLDRLSALVKWYRFEKLVGHLRDEAGPGRPGWPALVLLKAVLLQSLYGLSDRELEEALNDRLSFRRFVGLSLEQAGPDHTVLNRFRNRLIVEGLHEKLFAELDRQLEKAGVILKRGTMLDATLIETEAARPPRNGAEPVDPDARMTARKGKPGTTYGYKAHVGVDQGSGIIRAVITTPANVNDTVPADALIRGDEQAVYADKAYDTHARRARLKQQGVKVRLMRRPNQYHPLTPRQQRLNTLIARRRAAVETTFATWKRRMGCNAIRYVGLVKASAQITLAAIAFNLRRWVTISAPARPGLCPQS